MTNNEPMARLTHAALNLAYQTSHLDQVGESATTAEGDAHRAALAEYRAAWSDWMTSL